jgi:phospholipase A1
MCFLVPASFIYSAPHNKLLLLTVTVTQLISQQARSIRAQMAAAAAAASISGSRTCYPSVPMARGGRRRTSGCTVTRSSFAPCTPASTPSAQRIGSKWAELQGARDWDGLLSPLDGALRGELVRYGEFVRAAYASFDFDGGAPSYGSCRFPSRSLLRRAGMPGTGYRVTRLLHAASTSAPGWLPSSPPCGSSYIGFVAVCDDESEIERLGRRDVVVAFRGTATCGEWVDNFKSGLTRLPTTGTDEEEEEEPMVESGFWRLFTAPGEAHSSLQQQVRDEARRIANEYGGSGMPPLSITVTGHSLGAALAVLTAHEITTQQRQEHGSGEPMMVTAVSFGGPRVGNVAFRRRLEESGGKVLRVVNSDDIVTKVPGFPVVHEHDDDDSGAQPAKGMMKARLPRWLVSKMGWGYTDVGRELRLSSHSQANVVASHDLDLYLKLVASCTD